MKNVKRITSSLLSLLFVLIMGLFGGCMYIGYNGQYKGAVTLAYTAIPDTLGGWFYGPNYGDSSVVLLETDTQGRALYLYLESTEGALSALIVQKEDTKKVYFYSDDCFLSFKMPDRLYDLSQKKLSNKKITNLFYELCTEEKLQEFKALNDWGLDLQEDKLDSANIEKQMLSVVKNYRSGKVNISINTWERYMKSVGVANGHNFDSHFENHNSSFYTEANWMATDKYGRELYYLEGYYYTFNDGTTPYLSYVCTYLEMVAIVNPDGTFNSETFMVELTDKYNCQAQLKALKEVNNWNKPLSTNNGEGGAV